jgi:hypothetical protein
MLIQSKRKFPILSLYSVPHLILSRVITSMRMRLMGHAAQTWETKMHAESCLKNLKWHTESYYLTTETDVNIAMNPRVP